MSQGVWGYKEASVRPPMLNGSNYAFWKTRMTAYIRGMDGRAWRNVIVKWEPPVKTVEGVTEIKDELTWTLEEDQLSAANSRALNAIFAAVEPEIYALIQQCTAAKDAWDFLRITYEGTDKVKESKMQQLTTRFENLKMGDNETVTAYNSRLMTISNESHALGEPLSMEKLVKKALRTLSQKFAMHKISISQTHNLKTLTLAELMGELEAYECEMETENPPKKSKNLALRTDVTEEEDDSDTDQMALLTKQFGRFLKTMKKKNPEMSQTAYRPDLKNMKVQDVESGENYKQSDKGKGVQCYECEGYGHVQKECPNFLRKQKKSMVAQLSDTDSEGDEKSLVKCLALTATDETPESSQVTEEVSDSDTDTEITEESIAKESEAFQTEVSQSDVEDSGSDTDTEITEGTITEKYHNLFTNWKKLTEVNLKLKKDKASLSQEVKDLKVALDVSAEELLKANTEVGRLTKFMSMMTKGTNQLDDIIDNQRHPKNKVGLGFENKTKEIKTKFVRESGDVKAPGSSADWTKDTRICDFCNKTGHIMRKCKLFLTKYRRRDEAGGVLAEPVSRRVNQRKSRQQYRRVRSYQQEYYPDQNNSEVYYHHSPDSYYSNRYYEYYPREEQQMYWNCYVSFTSTNRVNSDHWYFDSGCSVHMTGKREFLTHIVPIKEGYVSYVVEKEVKLLEEVHCMYQVCLK